jgi:RimJ/RimL family protein N-acetyltransferase
MATPHWPLFALRLVTERLVLRPVTDADLPAIVDAVDAGVHEPGFMPFSVPWTEKPPPERARGLAQHVWKARTEWSTNRWVLHLVVTLDGVPIGMQDAFTTDFPVMREATTGSWLTQSMQGKGYGKEMRAALLTLLFDGLDTEIARTAARVDNMPSLGVTRSLGYAENGRQRIAPYDKPVDLLRFEMTRAAWDESTHPRATIENLDPTLFGLPASPSKAWLASHHHYA